MLLLYGEMFICPFEDKIHHKVIVVVCKQHHLCGCCIALEEVALR